MKKAVVLFSGGLDSTTCLAIALSQGYEPYALSFDYGQRHDAELIAAKRISQALGVKHIIIPLNLSHITTSALIDNSLKVPDFSSNDEIPITYVPARNTTFLSIALGLAETIEAQDIFIGVSQIDYSGYPDCRPEFIQAFEHLANLATKAGTEGKSFHIHTPLLHLSKAQTIQKGISLGINYAHTVSCYQLSPEGKACGICDSCVLRKNGFMDAKIEDPTIYS